MRISDWSSDVCSSDLLTLQLSDAHLLRNLQVGFRYNRRLTSRYYGYRDGFPRIGGARTPLTDFPGGADASLTGPRTEERRVGEECVHACHSWWCADQ